MCLALSVSCLVKPDSLGMSMLLVVESLLWSIIGDAGFVVSSVVPSAQALCSFHILTGKMGTRPSTIASRSQESDVARAGASAGGDDIGAG
jgi:hypothetical protein